jgi:hypothetical protein
MLPVANGAIVNMIADKLSEFVSLRQDLRAALRRDADPYNRSAEPVIWWNAAEPFRLSLPSASCRKNIARD